MMKFLICGVGSIGERHIMNLLTLGYDDIILYRTRSYPFRTIDKEFPTYSTLDMALAQQPDVAFICNPTHLHMETAIQCAKANCHLFIEKPVSNNTDCHHQLQRLVDNNNTVAMVGYMMRYHPCILKIKKMIEDDLIGDVVSLRATWGEYLPNWHPWEDYRLSYTAQRRMGGGPALTLSHELDLALWLFGNVKKVMGLPNYNSNLELSTEHGIDILILFENGVTANIHLDYLQKPPVHNTEIVGNNGRIYFDYFNNKVELYTHQNKSKNESFLSQDFDRNDMFVSELKDFITAVNHKKPSPIPLKDAYLSVDVALRALNQFQ